MTMTNSPSEVPNELRDFVERSIDQARKVFEGFLEVAQRTAAAAAEVNATQADAKLVGAQVLAYAEQNVNAAFELANKVVRAKGPQEALALQSEYLETQLAALQTQAKELGAIMQK